MTCTALLQVITCVSTHLIVLIFTYGNPNDVARFDSATHQPTATGLDSVSNNDYNLLFDILTDALQEAIDRCQTSKRIPRELVWTSLLIKTRAGGGFQTLTWNDRHSGK